MVDRKIAKKKLPNKITGKKQPGIADAITAKQP